MQIPQLTFLRFLAALGVVFFHFGGQVWPLNLPALAPLVQQGGLGVGFFFTLSGFLMAWVYGKQEKLLLKPYLRARFARIAPLYWFSFGLALMAWMVLRGLKPRGFSIILQSLGLQAWVPDYSLTLNFPGWSVSVELFLYAMFPLLLWALRGRGLAVWIITAFAAIGLGLLQWETCGSWSAGWFVDPNADFILRFPLWHLPPFVVGVCGGLVYLHHPDFLAKSKWLPPLLFLVCVAFLVALCHVPNPILPRAANGLLSPVFILMILALAQDKSPLSALFAKRFPVFLGEISYAMYLLQCPVYLLVEWISNENGALGIKGIWFWTYLALLLAASSLAFVGLERPARRWLRS
jgi:peptidoglycan/LPS O-acetylase OafA/YrhL